MFLPPPSLQRPELKLINFSFDINYLYCLCYSLLVFGLWRLHFGKVTVDYFRIYIYF